MWLMVLFDLPVTSSKERKAAQTFRKFLLNNGFEMSQFSVYFRFCGTKEKTEPYITRIKNNSPLNGKISILFFTDKQFSEIINIYGGITVGTPKKPKQLTIF